MGGGTYPGQNLTWPGGYPPPPWCGQTDACENSTFPHPLDAGGNDLFIQCIPLGNENFMEIRIVFEEGANVKMTTTSVKVKDILALAAVI